MMSLLNRYVVRQLTTATLYALVALLALYFFFDVMGQIGDVGQGSYNNAKMLWYVTLQIPAHAYELMPLAVLIGGLVALSQLAAHSELTVIKTSGVRLRRIIGMVLQFAAVFAVATLLLGEWVVPAVGQRAEQFKLNATQDKISAGTRSGIWIKQNNDIINVAEMLPDSSLRDITIYRHNDNFELTETVYAAAATPQSAAVGNNANANNAIWHLQQVRRTELQSNRAVAAHSDTLEWPAAVSRQLLNVLLVEPEQMSIAALGTYVQHLQDNHQQTTRYELAWWRKISYPLAALVMALVALAFTPQQTRHGNMGLKLFFGVCLGLAFHFAGRLFGFSSQLYGIPPFLAAILPTLLFACLAVWLIRKQERR